MSREYSTFGNANPLTKDEIDPVDRCVGNVFFNKTGIDGANMQQDFCPRFMAQRCGAKWDAYCDAYLTSTKTDMGGYSHVDLTWLGEVARKKYCRLNTEAAGTHCARACESFNAIGQSSVEICEYKGTQNWMDTKAELDLAGNYIQTGQLNPISPLYLDSCPLICDAKENLNADALTNNDMVLNKCIELGGCSQVLNDLAYNVVKNKTPVSNGAFSKLINAVKIDMPINPNSVVKIAQSYGIPATAAVDILQEAQKNSKAGFSVGEGNLNDPVIAPVVKKTMRNTKKEGFYAQHEINDSTKIIAGSLAGLLVIGIVLFCLRK